MDDSKQQRAFRNRPGGLYWRLTVSYFLVTLVAVLVIEAATVLLPLIQEYQQFSTSTPLDRLLETQEAPKIVPYLQQASPDRTQLGNTVLVPLLYTVAGYAESGQSQTVVLDRTGQPQGAASCMWTARLKTPVGDCVAGAAALGDLGLDTGPVQKSIADVLAGGGSALLPLDRTGGGAILVVPVRDATGQVAGALATILHGPLSLSVPLTAGESSLGLIGEFFRTFLSRIQPAGLAFLLLATAIGTLTGVLISRNLTGRLRHITQAADAWSRGEFEVAVADPARDEVGQLARDLNHMAAQIQALLATRNELAVVEERNRLARELHDSVKQQVFAAALLVRAARKQIRRDPATAEGHLAEAEALADQTQEELVALIGALRPAALADKGLGAVLQEYVADWSRRMGIAAEVRLAGAQPAPLDVEDTLFRVAQEALANVARHSAAHTVEVRLAWTGDEVCLTVQDDGQGFDPARVDGKGRGLGNMRERVEALGGRLMIASSPEGTSVTASASLARQPALTGKGET